jgi:hypothetical protein
MTNGIPTKAQVHESPAAAKPSLVNHDSATHLTSQHLRQLLLLASHPVPTMLSAWLQM